MRKLDEGLRNVLGYEVREELTRKDLGNVSQEVKEVVAGHGKVRLFLYMSEMPGMGPGAVVEDLKLVPYASSIERYAIVGDAKLLEWAENAGDALIGGEIKHFEDSRYKKAWRWIQS